MGCSPRGVGKRAAAQQLEGRLCREAGLKWAPARHRLFHPAHRSTVLCVMLVVRRSRQRRGFGWGWIAEIPAEIWFAIAEHLGRTGWPNGGRDALPLQMPPRPA